MDVLIPSDGSELTPGYMYSLGTMKKSHSGKEGRRIRFSTSQGLKNILMSSRYDSIEDPTVVLSSVQISDAVRWMYVTVKR